MSFLSSISDPENSRQRCLTLLIIIMCATLLALWDGGGKNLKTDGPVIRLESKAILRQPFARDTISTTLAAGDSVRVLGIKRSSFGQIWLVETSRGDIGWIDAADLSGIRQIVTDGPAKGDTVSIKAKLESTKASYAKAYIYVQDGQEIERGTDDFMPDLPGWDDYTYNLEGRTGVSSQEKLRKDIEGRTLPEVNKALGSPVLLRVTSSGIEAQYCWKAYDPATGEMFLPDITFGTDSIVNGVSFGRPTKRAASWLKHMPLVVPIIDCPLTSLYIRASRYDRLADPMTSGFKKVLIICLVALIAVMYAIWMFAAQAIPVLLMGWLLKFPIVFKPLSDPVLKILMLLVALACAYFQSVVMMAWGMFPFWSVIILIISWYAFSLASSPLCYYPHIRCPRCRHLYTIHFDHEVLESSEIKKGVDIVRGKLLGTHKEKWKQGVRVTEITKYGDGHTTTNTYNKNMRNMARDIKTYQYIDYEVTYHLDHYRLYYVCSNCGKIEEDTAVRCTELDRKITGSHTGEEAGEAYDNGFGWN